MSSQLLLRISISDSGAANHSASILLAGAQPADVCLEGHVRTYLFYLILGLIVVVLQTTILKVSIFSDWIYDLLIPFILFCCFSLSVGQGACLAVSLGLVMDIMSGGIVGIHITTYVWIFLSVRAAAAIFDVQSIPSQAVLGVLSVLFENFVMFSYFKMLSAPDGNARVLAGDIAWQAGLVFVTTPPFVAFLQRMHKRSSVLLGIRKGES